MNMLKLRILLVALVGFIFNSAMAINTSQAISMVKANPALLNTPQAQAELAKRGLTAGDVMGRIGATDAKADISSVDIAVNNIEESNATELNDTLTKVTGIYNNPLAYKSNTDLLKTIKAKQSIEKDVKLERFSEVFFRNKNTQDHSSLPVPDYYVVSNGDVMSIWVYGVTEETFEASVDSYGNINIPIVGPINVAGLSFKNAKDLIVSKLTTAYSNSSIIVNIAKYSTIQVSLTGNVMAPGIYNVSALSTVKDLLIHAGGIKANGTVRAMTLQRADGSIHGLDLYEFLLGQKRQVLFLKTGDMVYIPNAHKVVSIAGAVNTPAKYELKVGEKLDKLLDFAGGIRASGSHYGLKVSGFDKEQTQVRMVDASNASGFGLNDQDSVYVYPVDGIKSKSISLFGNVTRPGKRALSHDASLAKLIKSEVDKFGLEGVFLDNTLFNFAMIKRKTDTLGREFVRVNIDDVLSGSADEVLKAGDELYIFNKLDKKINPPARIKTSDNLSPSLNVYSPGNITCPVNVIVFLSYQLGIR